MRIGIAEENTATSNKRVNQQQINKLYKNYNKNNKIQQQQQHMQQEQQQHQNQNQQQQQQKTRTFPKIKQTNGNSSKNINNKYQNSNGVHFIDGNYINGISKNAKTLHYESNYNGNGNSCRNNNTSCSSNSSSRNSSPILSISTENFVNITANTKSSINPQVHHMPNAIQQQQKYYRTDNSLIKNQNLFSTSTETDIYKMVDSPVTSAVYSATWKTRNTSINTITNAIHNCNDDNNNINGNIENNNSCCQALPPTATTSIAKAVVATLLSPQNRCNSPTIPTSDLHTRQQQPHQSNFLSSNAKISSIEQNSPKNHQRNSLSSLSTTIAATSITTLQTSEQQQEQEKEQLQLFSNDCPNSYQSLSRTQSTTARTKSAANNTSSSSSSSLPFPLGTTVANNNNTGNQGYGTKGGGGGKLHHLNRKKFWKIGAGSGGAVTISSIAGNAGPAGSNGSISSNLSNINGISRNTNTDSNVIINSAPPKPTIPPKSSNNNRNPKYQPQSQLQYPETWKKQTIMTTSVTSSVATSSTANVNSTLNGNKSSVTDGNKVPTAASTITTNTATTIAVDSMTLSVTSTDHTKLEEKFTSDASTTTERALSDEKSSMPVIQQPLLPAPLPPYKNKSHVDNCGSVNRNYPSGMPSYTLDFLHSVGKRMLAVNSAVPTSTGGRITSTTSASNNPTAGPPQQSGHRSNRFVSHNNSGYGNNNPHHHHHPQPQQLTIASFLQKDMFGAASSGIRTVSNGNVASSNNTSNNASITTENSPHSYNNQTQHQQHRFHNFYNHPPSATHFYRQQGIYQAYNSQNGMISNPGNNTQRYHNSHGSNSSTSVEHPQRQQHTRNPQQRQHLSQQQQFGSSHNNGNNLNFGACSPKHTHKISQQSKNQNLQNTSSPSSSTSSLSSLTSTASSPLGGNSRQSNGSNKSTSRPNSALDMMPPKNTPYSVGPNTGNFRHNSHNRHHTGHHFNHHPGQNGLSSGGVLAQHQNITNFSYVVPASNGAVIGAPPSMPNFNGNSHPAYAIPSESSSRACSPSFLSSSDNPSPEPSQSVLLGVTNRFIHPDPQPFLINSQNMRPTSLCPPIINISQNDGSVASKHDSNKSESGCNEVDDSECSSVQPSDNTLQRCNSFQHIRPGSSLSHSSQSGNSHVQNPIEFAFNPMIQQLQPSSAMHFQAHPYRNNMIPPVGNLPPNAFHEDDFHIQGAIQQQLPNMFFTSNDQSNAPNGHNNNAFSNTNNVVYSQSAMTLIPTCASTASSMSRSSEEESLIISSRSSSSGSDQLKGSAPDIPTAVLNEMHDQMGGMNRGSSGANTLSSTRPRSARNQQHSHPIPPPFMHYPFSQQSVFCSNYLAYLRSTPSNTSSDLNSNTPPDRFMSRSHLVEVRETPKTLVNNSKWDNLSQQIWGKFIDAQQTEETFKLKMRLWRYLYVTIKQTYPRYGLYLVGSTMSGFGADTSDVDMCLVSRSFAFVEQRMEALFNLTILRECLRKTEDFESFNLIEAKVPILRFRDKSNHFEVDLNFNNSVGIKNTHLLYCYTQLDWRLRPLALIVKLWAQYHDINNAKNMTISSYSLVLMVIHFLQCGVSPPVLPCLHKMFPEKFTPLRSNEFGHVDMNDNVGPYESKNTQPLGELFLNFLEYYSSFEQNAISIRTGGLLPVNVCRQAKSVKNDIHQWKELCIEEPFDLTNTARSVYDFDTFERVKAVFSTSFHVLQKTLELNTIFAPLVLPRLPISARIYMKRTPMPNASLIPKVPDSEDHQEKNFINNNDKPIDFCDEQKSNSILDDQKHIEDKTVGRGDATPATAL